MIFVACPTRTYHPPQEYHHHTSYRRSSCSDNNEKEKREKRLAEQKKAEQVAIEERDFQIRMRSASSIYSEEVKRIWFG